MVNSQFHIQNKARFLTHRYIENSICLQVILAEQQYNPCSFNVIKLKLIVDSQEVPEGHEEPKNRKL